MLASSTTMPAVTQQTLEISKIAVNTEPSFTFHEDYSSNCTATTRSRYNNENHTSSLGNESMYFY